MAQTKTNDFYVNISEPAFIRRTTLESSRAVIHILQDYERLKQIREKKHELFQEFDKIIKEINSLSLKINSDLPTVPRSKKKSKKRSGKSKKENIKIDRVVPKQKSVLESLENELKLVEEQLNQLK